MYAAQDLFVNHVCLLIQYNLNNNPLSDRSIFELVPSCPIIATYMPLQLLHSFRFITRHSLDPSSSYYTIQIPLDVSSLNELKCKIIPYY